MKLQILTALLVANTALAQDGPPPPNRELTVTDIVDPQRRAYIITDFQRQLARLGSASSVTCGGFLEVRDATVRRDYSYGASCTVTNGSRRVSALMCNDYLVGHFTLGGSDSASRVGISRFVEKNCPPGG